MELPGGRVEPCESLTEALRREVKGRDRSGYRRN
ncbi:NUDIX domain-containing protein [Paenibacillus apiarius]